jgi:hypothetical protein
LQLLSNLVSILADAQLILVVLDLSRSHNVFAHISLAALLQLLKTLLHESLAAVTFTIIFKTLDLISLAFLVIIAE